jgi:hypothetical protein
MTTSQLTVLVSLLSLAIQRLVELIDEPLGALALHTTKSKMAEDIKVRKKTYATLTSIILGIVGAHLGAVHLLHEAGLASIGAGPDLWLSGFVLGSGTEAANSVLKYVSYVKDGRGALASAVRAGTISPDPGSFRRM